MEHIALTPGGHHMTNPEIFEIVAIVIQNRIVSEVPALGGKWTHNQAVQLITALEGSKDLSAQLGSRRNPLRYEGISRGGRVTINSNDPL
jgi:hypothetical protein